MVSRKFFNNNLRFLKPQIYAVRCNTGVKNDEIFQTQYDQVMSYGVIKLR